MAKNAVYLPSILREVDDIPLKRLSLLFDKIYINKVFAFDAIQNISPTPMPDEIAKIVDEVLINFEYLIKNEIVVITEPFPSSAITKDIRKEMDDDIANYLKIRNTIASLNDPEEKNELEKSLIPKSQDLFVRIETAVLNLNQPDEFFPILKSKESFQTTGKKEKVVQFLLANIPEPEANIPWEQILDFKNDEDTRLKYLALINWINDIAKSNYTLIEIRDKYDYLYLDYKRNYERHKIKSTFNTLEILVAAGTAFFTGNIPAGLKLASNFLKIGTSTLNLLKEEGNIPGKEIAYIYHANKEFSF